jgi:hypothetical protein
MKMDLCLPINSKRIVAPEQSLTLPLACSNLEDGVTQPEMGQLCSHAFVDIWTRTGCEGEDALGRTGQSQSAAALPHHYYT